MLYDLLMPKLSGSAVQRVAVAWAAAKEELKRWEEREADQNALLKAILPDAATKDPNDGHYYLDVALPDGTALVVQMQMRHTIYMDPDLAEKLLAEHGKLDEYSAWEVRVTDNDLAAEFLLKAGAGEHAGFEVTSAPTEESVRQALYDKVLTDKEYAQIFTDTEIPALYRQKGRKG
jgi:hypothetical protein